MEVAGLIVAGISALGTLIHAYFAAKDSKKNVQKSIIKQAKGRAEEPLKTGAKRVSQVIDDNLLIAIQSRVEDQCRKLIWAIESMDISEPELEQIVAQSRREICRFLSQVMEHNAGELPTKRLKDLWESHRC
jgi:hypothetical protein